MSKRIKTSGTCNQSPKQMQSGCGHTKNTAEVQAQDQMTLYIAGGFDLYGLGKCMVVRHIQNMQWPFEFAPFNIATQKPTIPVYISLY